MAYVYADMDALAAFQQRIVETLSLLEEQAVCKEDLICRTEQEIRAALAQAEEEERAASAALQAAQEQLREAERRTAAYNANLTEDETPLSTPSYLYDMVETEEQRSAYAESARVHAENTLANFTEYVRSYRRQQTDGLAHFKKLLAMSGQFFEAYLQKLVEVKQATAVSGGASGPGGGPGGAADPVLTVKEAGRQWTGSLPKEQYAALSAYTGAAYGPINAALRGLSGGFGEGEKETAVLIHQALSACRLPQSCTVYRGVSAAALGPLQNVPDDRLVGLFFTDKGFMSTSLNKEDAFGGAVKLVIDVPAGAKGAYVGYLSQMGHSESEVLFDLGQVMQITAVERDDSGRRVIRARMMTE